MAFFRRMRLSVKGVDTTIKKKASMLHIKEKQVHKKTTRCIHVLMYEIHLRKGKASSNEKTLKFKCSVKQRKAVSSVTQEKIKTIDSK